MLAERNILFLGSPGVGKSYCARRLVKDTIASLQESRQYVEDRIGHSIQLCSFEDVYKNYKSGAIEIVQISPTLSYEDFIEGVEAYTSESRLLFRTVKKVATRIIDRAQNDQNFPYFLILEDIHNTNIRRLFGELFYAIDKREEKITLSSGTKISIPNNLYIIATGNSMPYAMNMDYSVIRRFCVKRIKTDDTVINYAVTDQGVPITREELNNIDLLSPAQTNQRFALELFDNVNNHILAKHNFSFEFVENREDYLIGHGYFMLNDNLQYDLESNKKKAICYKIWHQVIPLLKQYQNDGIITMSDSLDGEIRALDVYTGHQKYYVVDNGEMEQYPVMQHALELRYQEVNRNSKGFRAEFYDKIQRKILRGVIRKIVENPLIDYQNIWERILYSSSIVSFPIQINNNIKQMSEPGMRIDDNEHLFSRGSVEKNIQYGSEGQEKDQTIPYSKREDTVYVDNQQCFMLTRMQTFISMSDQNYLRSHPVNYGFSGVKKGVILFDLIYKVIWEYIKTYNELVLDCFPESADYCDAIINNFNESFNALYTSAIQCNTDDKWGPINANAALKQTCENALGIFLQNCWILGKNPGDSIQYTDRNGNVINEIMKGVYKLMDTNYQSIMDISGIHQMILQGPPGTSKTYGAKEFLTEQAGLDSINQLDSYQLKTENDEYVLPDDGGGKLYWDIVQFHPSYSYEDFVRGITVSTNVYSLDQQKEHLEKIQGLVLNQTGTITYKTVNRTLGKMAKIAKEEYDSAINEGRSPKKFYIVVDEINRANLAIVFGELIYALEYRKTPVASPYHIEGGDYQIEIPDNLYLIGTMNTADKSIGSIDYALRRRFLFFSLLPNRQIVLDKANGDEESFEVKLFDLIDELFDEFISDDFHKEDVQVGHTYFLRKDLSGKRNIYTGQEDNNGSELSEDKKDILYRVQMRTRFIYQVIPIITEYCKDGVLKKESDSQSTIVKFVMSWARNEPIEDGYNTVEVEDLKNAGYWNLQKTEGENTSDNQTMLDLWNENPRNYADDLRYTILYKLLMANH